MRYNGRAERTWRAAVVLGLPGLEGFDVLDLVAGRVFDANVVVLASVECGHDLRIGAEAVEGHDRGVYTGHKERRGEGNKGGAHG